MIWSAITTWEPERLRAEVWILRELAELVVTKRGELANVRRQMQRIREGATSADFLAAVNDNFHASTPAPGVAFLIGLAHGETELTVNIPPD